ncbi:hypothetical protein [Acinetobacter sp. 99]|uniref:hypothetical protein n=1 Tax=Acinetobacter sp. 99 TaxID=3098765 RepID=UPI00300A2EE4
MSILFFFVRRWSKKLNNIQAKTRLIPAKPNQGISTTTKADNKTEPNGRAMSKAMTMLNRGGDQTTGHKEW